MGKKKEPAVEVHKVNEFARFSDHLCVTMTEWSNGEGVHVWIDTPDGVSGVDTPVKQVSFDISWEQFEDLRAVVKAVWARYTGEKNG